MKKIICLSILFTTNLTVSSDRDNVTIANQLGCDFICSVQSKTFQAIGYASSEDEEEYGNKKRRKQGPAIQSMLIAPQRSINVSLHIASQVEQYCLKVGYQIECNQLIRTMKIHPKK